VNANRITWLGHSTVLAELDGVRLLTDPLLRRRVLHLRRVAPLPELDAAIDAVLVSHTHWDHLDLPSLRRIGHSTRVVVPRGAGRLLRRAGFTTVDEVDPGEVVHVGDVSVTATPAEHDSGGRLRRAVAPALGFVLSCSCSVYFAGDTDVFPGMADLATGLDLALLPVWGWGPRLPAGHMDPRRAAEALTLLRPRSAVPVHWDTYRAVGARRASGADPSPGEAFRRFAADLAPEVEVEVLPVGGALTL